RTDTRRWSRTVRERPRTPRSPISPWPRTPVRSRPAHRHGPNGSRSTTSCCASRNSSATPHATPAAEPSRASRPEPDTGTHRGGRGAAQQHALRANGLPPAHSAAAPDHHLRSPRPAPACAVGGGSGGGRTGRGRGAAGAEQFGAGGSGLCVLCSADGTLDLFELRLLEQLLPADSDHPPHSLTQPLLAMPFPLELLPRDSGAEADLAEAIDVDDQP